MTHAQHTHVSRYGFRGRALTLVGLVWILVGFGVLLEPDATPILSDLIPTWIRVAIWTGTGIVAIVTAWWPPGADRWGFMALIVPAAIRALANVWSAFLGLVLSDRVGDPGDWIGAIAWTVIVAFVLLLSAWPEAVQLNNRHSPDAEETP